jgi:hypothetical protein
VRAPLALLLAGLLVAGCGGDLEALAPESAEPPAPSVAPVPGGEATPQGTVRVAVPEAVTDWLPLQGTPAVVGDLAALWGLPLYHLDAAGQARPALVEEAEVDASGREVILRLRPGRWSDGEAVQAGDLAATVDALRDAGAAEVAGVEEVVVEDASVARVVLEAPSRTWQDLLGRIGVLPAHVLEDGGLDAAADLAVTGGPFRLVEHDEGLVSRFVAHPDGPLGSPALEAIEAIVVPSFDTALGLLRDGELDAAVGHLAARPAERVAALGDEADSFEVAAPFGGTSVTLAWSDDAAVGADARRAMAQHLRLAHQVEALDLGTSLVGPAPGVPGPELEDEEADPEDLGEVDASLVLQNEQELLSLAASLVEAQIRGQDGRLRVERLPSPEDIARRGEFDGWLTARRDGPWTSTTTWVPPALAAEVEPADRVASHHDPDAVAALSTVTATGWQVPLYRPRVTHVWRAELQGVAASAWPSAGFVSAARWQWDDGA